MAKFHYLETSWFLQAGLNTRQVLALLSLLAFCVGWCKYMELFVILCSNSSLAEGWYKNTQLDWCTVSLHKPLLLQALSCFSGTGMYFQQTGPVGAGLDCWGHTSGGYYANFALGKGKGSDDIFLSGSQFSLFGQNVMIEQKAQLLMSVHSAFGDVYLE